MLKIDNGGACRSALLRRWAHRVGVALLHSPPVWPQYNGSIEASIGALATRTHQVAAWHGHPEYWAADDIALACQQANAAPGRSGEPPVARWQHRTVITAAERARFWTALHAVSSQLAADQRAVYSERVRQRLALVRTLQELGYVRITRRGDFVH